MVALPGPIMKRGLLVSLCLILVAPCNPAPGDVALQTATAAAAIASARTERTASTATASLTLSETPINTATATPPPITISASTTTLIPIRAPSRFLTKTSGPTAIATRPRAVTLVRAPTPVGSIYIPNATIVCYDISGSTEGEMRAQLNALGPVDNAGHRFDAQTKWFIRWNWPGYGRRLCNLNAAIVTYEIQVIFPRWRAPANASPDLIAKWINYTRRLAEHEKGHVDFVVANYHSVRDAIGAADCETAEVAAQAAIARIRQHDVDYDAATKHGATQGAKFP